MSYGDALETLRLVIDTVPVAGSGYRRGTDKQIRRLQELDPAAAEQILAEDRHREDPA